MTKIGIIAEFNPFHEGHAYLINKVKEKFPDSAIITVMSGDFTQRGDIAIFDKYIRAESALKGGADLVVMLPTTSSLQSAEGFANDGVFLLESLGCTHLAFGVEDDNLSDLEAIADFTIPHEELMSLLKEGLSYPAAISTICNRNNLKGDLISKPNNNLALEYLRALKKNNKLTPIAIKRIGHDYNDESFEGQYPSAMAIRKALRDNALSIDKALPVFDEYLDEFIILALKTALHCNTLCTIRGYSKSLENKFKKYSDAITPNELISLCKSKDITYLSIKRFLTCNLLGIKDIQSYPEYIRVLGLNEKGRACLNDIKKGSTLPIISNITEDTEITPMLKTDLFANEIYRHVFKKRYNISMKEDTKRHPVISS